MTTWANTYFPGRRARIAVAIVMALIVAFASALTVELRTRHTRVAEALEQIAPRYARLAGLLEHRDAIEAAVSASREVIARHAYPADLGVERVGTDVQQRVRQIAEAHGLSVINSRILPVREGTLLDFVPVMITVQGDGAALRGLLLAVPGAPPSVQIEALVVQAARGRAASDMLTAQLTLSVMRVRE